MKKEKYIFHLLTEDLDLIESVSPPIVKTLDSLFFYKHIVNKSADVDYYEYRLAFCCLHHANRRRMLSLIHSVHVVSCSMYKYNRFNEYLAFDALLVRLLRLL